MNPIINCIIISEIPVKVLSKWKRCPTTTVMAIRSHTINDGFKRVIRVGTASLLVSTRGSHLPNISIFMQRIASLSSHVSQCQCIWLSGWVCPLIAMKASLYLEYWANSCSQIESIYSFIRFLWIYRPFFAFIVIQTHIVFHCKHHSLRLETKSVQQNSNQMQNRAQSSDKLNALSNAFHFK